MKPEQSVYNKLHKFSAKEEPMKVELSSEEPVQVELGIAEELNSLNKLANDLNDRTSLGAEAEKEVFFKFKAAVSSYNTMPAVFAVKAETALKELEKADMRGSKVYANLENAVKMYRDYSERSRKLRKYLDSVYDSLASQKYS